MALIKSISGIRGTIGGPQGENLTPADIVKFTTAYSRWLKTTAQKPRYRVVVGRDARISGRMVMDLVCGTLMGCGIDVIDMGLCTTPGVEMAVAAKMADGGIIITASHNPRQWNALKLLNSHGEFLNDDEGKKILALAAEDFDGYATVDELGHIIEQGSFDKEHIDAVISLSIVDINAVKSCKFKVVADAVNSVGGIVVPQLLRRMGCEIIELNCEVTGEFAHNPEPLPEHLAEISQLVVRERADLGVVVDPDVDRLALVCEDGSMFGEEYTLVAVADYVLSVKGGNTVSNLSSSRALRDITHKYGGRYTAAAVGEVHTIELMKATGAVIGGEGNGGIIYPELHYGRDALVGIALFLTHLARKGVKCSELRKEYPEYHISKNKITLTPDIDVDVVLDEIKRLYASEKITDIDGVKIDFLDEWVHLRKSNTEPIIRIYAEAKSADKAENLAQAIIEHINDICNL